jgi:hypothetical protein
VSAGARSTALLLVGLVSLLGRTAAGADAAPPRVVRVFVAGSAPMVEKTRATVRELCARLDLDVVVENGGDESLLESIPESTFAEAFIDYRAPGAPRIVVVQAKPRRELERRTLPYAGSPEMTVEEAAHVVYAVVESSLRAREAKGERRAGAWAPAGTASSGTGAPVDGTSGGPAEATTPTASGPPTAGPSAEHPNNRNSTEAASSTVAPRSTAPQSEPSSAPGEREPHGDQAATATPVAFRADLGAFASAWVQGAFRPVPGLGGAVDVGAEFGAWRIGGAFLGGSSFASDVSGKGGEASFHTEFARGFATVEWQSLRRLAILCGLGGGADRITVGARAAPPRVQSAGAETRVDPLIAGLAGVRVRLAGPLSVVGALLVDTDLTPHRFVAESASGRAVLFELGRVHASALAGFSVALSGAADAPSGEP